MISPRRPRGFTLIETLLVLLLSSFVFLAINSSLWQGIKVFNRLSALAGQQAVAFAFETLTRDVKNSMEYSRIPFQVTPHALSFASLTNRPLTEGQDAFWLMPSGISYRFDPDKKTLSRIQTELPFKDSKTEVVLSGVEDVSFEVRSGGEDLPTCISVSVRVVGGSHPLLLERSIDLPTRKIFDAKA